jgi:hypothetical protein
VQLVLGLPDGLCRFCAVLAEIGSLTFIVIGAVSVPFLGGSQLGKERRLSLICGSRGQVCVAGRDRPGFNPAVGVPNEDTTFLFCGLSNRELHFLESTISIITFFK